MASNDSNGDELPMRSYHRAHRKSEWSGTTKERSERYAESLFVSLSFARHASRTRTLAARPS
jgi:hypothetical protein